MKTSHLHWFPRCRAAAVLLLLLIGSAVSLFGQITINRLGGRILAEVILDGGVPPGMPTQSQQDFASFFDVINHPNEGVLLNGRGQLADGSWNCSGQSPAYNAQYGLGPCGTTSPLIQFPFAPLSANQLNQPMSISLMSAVLPGHLPNGEYSGKFLLEADTSQHLKVSLDPVTPGVIDDWAVPYWMDLRIDLGGGDKHYYFQSFRSKPLLPWDSKNACPPNSLNMMDWPVDKYTLDNILPCNGNPSPNPIIEPVGALHVEVYCPDNGQYSLLNVVSALITATIDTPTQMPACDPPYLGWRGAQGTVQASVDMPGGGLVDKTFLVRAGLSYVVKVEFVVYDILGNVAAAYSAPATIPVLQGRTVYVRIDVDKLFCDMGPGCHSDLGRLYLNGADVFMDMTYIPPSVVMRNGPFGTSKAAFIENPLSSPTMDPSGTTYVPANNYKLGNVLPSHAVWPQVWPDTPYTPVAAFYFQTTGGFFEHMTIFSDPKMYNCIGYPVQGQQEDFFVMEPGFVSGDILLCGPPQVGTAPTCIELIRADDLNQSSAAQIFFELAPYSWVGANRPDNRGRAESAIRETLPRSAMLIKAKYDLWLTGTKPEPFSSWRAGGLILRMDQTFGASYLAINDRLASGALNMPLDVYPTMSYTNDHNYCVSEVLVQINNVSGQPIAGPQIVCKGEYSGSDPLYPAHSTSPTADYEVDASYWGTPASPNYTTGPLSVLVCLPRGNNYTLTGSIEKQAQGGGSAGRASFPGPFLADVGCKERMTVDIVYNDDAPSISIIRPDTEWTSQTNYTLKGSVQAISGHNLMEVSYALNNGPKNVVYSGGSDSFNLASIGPILLGPCKNTIIITATDAQPKTTISTPITITLDGTPPVLSGCTDIFATALVGNNGTVATYSVTALDNCDGSVTVNCDQSSGSFFPVGQTVVTCTAADKCANTTTCTFIVDVTPLPLTGPCVNRPANLVLWLPFDEAAGPTTRNVAGGNPGTHYNGAFVAGTGNGPAVINQYVARGLCFDGVDDYVQVPSYPAISFGKRDFAIDAWIKRNQEDNARGVLVSKQDNSAQPRGYSFFLDTDGRLGLQLADGVLSEFTSTLTAPTDGQWHHVAVTVRRDNVAGGVFFLDGVADPTPFNPLVSPGLIDNTRPLRVGCSSSGLADCFSGCIDEVDLYSRAITAAEINAIYHAGLSGKCKTTCTLPWDQPFCINVNSITVKAQICNGSSQPQTYSYSFQGEPTGPGCNIVGPTGFMASPRGPLSLQPGECAMIDVTIARPVGMTRVRLVGCYQMLVTNALTGEMSVCRGSVQDRRDLCVQLPAGIVRAAAGVPVQLTPFTISNNSETTSTVNYRIVVIDPDMQPDLRVVSLDGLPPGTPLNGTLSLPSGATTNLAVSVKFLELDPLRSYTVLMEADTDGDGIWEPLASATLINEIPPGVDSLRIQRIGDAVEITWDAAVTGFTLEVNEKLAVPAGWQAVARMPAPFPGGRQGVTVPLSQLMRSCFFRLRH